MKNIEQLRIFFRISNAAFEFKNKVHTAIGVCDSNTEMQELHRVALIEVEKESPDWAAIYKLLEQMEILALLQKSNKLQEKILKKK